MERLVTLFLLITRVAGNFDESCIPAHAEYADKTCVSSSSYTVEFNTASECLQTCLDDRSCLSASYTPPTQCVLNEGDCSLQDTAGSTTYIVARNNPRIPTAGCLIVRSELGEPETDENAVSFVQCGLEEVVTFCDCLPNQPPGTCNGITVTNAATRCNAFGGPIGETIRAIAWCGRGTMPSLSISNSVAETFVSDPEVTCPTTSPLLIGCYVQTDSVNVGFQTLGIQDVSTCQAQEGCNSCRVTAVCTSSPGPGQDTSLDSGNCQCARTVMGPPVSVEVGDNQSKAICAEGEVVTTCACLSTNGDQNVCKGVSLDDVRTCTASAREDFTTNTVTANACCSKLGGDVQIVQDPAPIAEYASNPSASCPAGYSIVGCFVSSTDDTGQIAFPNENTCSTLPSCTSCKVFGICLQRAQCEGYRILLRFEKFALNQPPCAPPRGDCENCVPPRGDCENCVAPGGDCQNCVTPGGDCENCATPGGDCQNCATPGGECDNCTDSLRITEAVNDTETETVYCRQEDTMWGYASRTSSLLLHFSTDSTRHAGEFSVTYTEFRAGACADTEFLCDRNRCLPGRVQCDYKKQCIDGTDENATSSGCQPRTYHAADVALYSLVYLSEAVAVLLLLAWIFAVIVLICADNPISEKVTGLGPLGDCQDDISNLHNLNHNFMPGSLTMTWAKQRTD